MEKNIESTLPKISIVTPSLNQGEFIEDTINSILDQDYPNLEYIIIDGGSTDNTLEIIKKYEDRISYWESVPDNGQTHAINKGIKRATGDLITYINSDDQLLLGSLNIVGTIMNVAEQSWISGSRYTLIDPGIAEELSVDEKTFAFRNEDGLNVYLWTPQFPNNRLSILYGWGVPQQSCFWRKELFEKYGMFREDMHYAFDTEFQARMAINDELPLILTMPLSKAYFHEESKTGSSKGSGVFFKEQRKIMDLHEHHLSEKELAEGRTILWLQELGNKLKSNRPSPTISQIIFFFTKYPKNFIFLLIKGILRGLKIIPQKILK